MSELQVRPVPAHEIKIAAMQGGLHLEGAPAHLQVQRQLEAGAGFDDDLHGIGAGIAQAKGMQRH